MVNLHSISATGRPLDFDWPTNRVIAALTLLVALVSGVFSVFSGLSLWDSLVDATRLAGGLFLAWAICREIDPDRQDTAFMASGLFLLWTVYANAPPLLPVLFMLLGIRILNRSTGLQATVFDLVVVTALGVWLAVDVHLVFGFLTLVFLVLDRNLPRMLLVAMLIAFPAVLFWQDVRAASGMDLVMALAVAILLSVGFTRVIRACRYITSCGDGTGVPLDPSRVQLAQMVALLSGILVAVALGTDGIGMMAAMWSAVLAASLVSRKRIVET